MQVCLESEEGEFIDTDPRFLPLLGAFSTLIFGLALIPLANKMGLIDLPNERKRHSNQVPMIGGTAIFIPFVVMLLSKVSTDSIIWFVCACSIVYAIGLIDDFRNVPISIRFISQILASALVIYNLDLWIADFGIFQLSNQTNEILIYVVTIFAVVGLTNAFNLIDGIDGLAAGLMLTCVALIVIAANHSDNKMPHFPWLMTLTAMVFVYGLMNMSIGWLPKVFLGDSGSLTLGFVAAWLLILYTQTGVIQPVVALWCVFLPTLDTVAIIVSRITTGNKIFAPDRSHLHHLLLDSDISPIHSLILIVVGSLAVGLSGILITSYLGQTVGLSVFLLCSVIYILFSYNMRKRLIGRR